MPHQPECTTESSSLPVHSSPGFSVICFSIAAPSTQSICLYSSSPKSTMDLDFFSHGFQTTIYKQMIKSVVSKKVRTCHEHTLLLLIWRLRNKLTDIWKSFLSYSECPLLLMIKNGNHIWRTKVNPIHLQIRKYFSHLSQEVVRNSNGCLEDVLPQIQMSRHLLVQWSALSGRDCQDSQEFPTPLLLLHCNLNIVI